ncbi:MAG: hypothetical protein WCO25_03735 [Candidatus Uhrbacteria bacterium]
MRSFPVRTASFLVIALLFTAWYLRPEKSGAPNDVPLPAVRRKADRPPVASRQTLLSPPPTLGSVPSPEDATTALLRSRIADVDRETSGFFLEEIERVLSDQTQSVAVEDYRLPMRDGTTAMLAAFPTETATDTEEQHRLALVYVASALHGCATPSDCQHRIDELTARCPWVVAYASQQ